MKPQDPFKLENILWPYEILNVDANIVDDVLSHSFIGLNLIKFSTVTSIGNPSIRFSCVNDAPHSSITVQVSLSSL